MSESYTQLFRGICVVALATLLFEIALTRVLSFTIWYHFAYVVISTALLGFGAAGTLLAVRPRIGAQDLTQTLTHLSLLAALTAAGFTVLVWAFPLHPMEIFEQKAHGAMLSLKDPQQAVVLGLYQLGATVPFFFSGLIISLLMRKAAARVDRLYFWDLIGAGLGCALAVPVMNAISPPGATVLAAAMFAVGAAVFARAPLARFSSLGLAIVLVLGAVFAERIPFTPANSKHLALHVQAQRMVPVFSRWTALFRTDVVEDQGLGPPFDKTQEFGLSRSAPDEIQAPWGFVTHDGTAGTPLYELGEGRELDFLDHHVLRLPYLVAKPNPRVLVIGVGGGRDVVTAMRYGASHVTGVELDPVTVELIRDDFDGIGRGFFRQPQIDLIAGEGRHFVKRTDRRFDVIQITGVDTLAAQSSGAYVLAENYLYTTEAFNEYLDRLEPGGVLSITTAHLGDNHPRESGRMVSVAQKALRERGIVNPGDHIAVIDSRWLFADVLIRNQPFEAKETEILAREADRLAFKILHLPGRMSHPVFAGLASATGVERQALLESLIFDVRAITDDSPFFFRFIRWSKLLDSGPITPVHTTALGQIVLLVLAVSLSALGALFVLAPLVVFRRRGIAGGGRKPLGILIYFTAVGLGFMLFEISLMQRFVIFLGYPTYSLSVTLFSLLTFLGCGSYLSKRWVGRERVVLPLAVGAIGLLALFYMQVLPWIQAQLLGSALALRVFMTVLMLAPLGLVLGLFLPLGIRRAHEIHEDLVPWAWGINGCASVTATVLTVMLAMVFGFRWVWTLSVAIYAIGVVGLLWLARPDTTSADA